MTDNHEGDGRHLVERLPPERAEEAIGVLCDSFRDYPVFPYVIAETGEEYERRLRTLIGFFVAARFHRDEPVLAISDAGRAVAVAILTPPVQRDSPTALAERREAVWRELGTAARERYEAMGESWRKYAILEPHYHLNMIGVRRSHGGRGLARLLLRAVHEISLRDPLSTGVSLTTEIESNVALYLRFGYELVGHVKGEGGPDTWVFFRRDGASE